MFYIKLFLKFYILFLSYITLSYFILKYKTNSAIKTSPTGLQNVFWNGQINAVGVVTLSTLKTRHKTTLFPLSKTSTHHTHVLKIKNIYLQKIPILPHITHMSYYKIKNSYRKNLLFPKLPHTTHMSYWKRIIIQT